MQRRTSLSLLATALVALVMAFVANTQLATAQVNPNCCTYTVDIAGIPPWCFPVTIVTEWGPGITQTFTVAMNGVYIDNIPNCPPPPAFPFNWVSVMGGPMVPFGATGSVVYNNGACILTYTTAVDANGCLVIIIR